MVVGRWLGITLAALIPAISPTLAHVALQTALFRAIGCCGLRSAGARCPAGPVCVYDFCI